MLVLQLFFSIFCTDGFFDLQQKPFLENYQSPKLSPIQIPYLPLSTTKLSLLSPFSITSSSFKKKINLPKLKLTLCSSTIVTSSTSSSVHALYPSITSTPINSTSNSNSDSLSF